jgi:hypothetical protein
VRRYTHALQATFLLDLIQHTHHPLREKRLTGAIEKNRRFIRISRAAILMNVLPKKLTHFWMQSYLTLFASLTEDFDIAIMNVSHLQATKLGTAHTCI